MLEISGDPQNIYGVVPLRLRGGSILKALLVCDGPVALNEVFLCAQDFEVRVRAFSHAREPKRCRAVQLCLTAQCCGIVIETAALGIFFAAVLFHEDTGRLKAQSHGSGGLAPDPSISQPFRSPRLRGLRLWCRGRPTHSASVAERRRVDTRCTAPRTAQGGCSAWPSGA